MSWKTPIAAAGVLREPRSSETIVLGSTAWFAWLADDQHCSFHFAHPAGDFTARKERKQRGQMYWVAYRQLHGKLYKTYLGKSETLTEAHLCAAAQELAQAEERRILSDRRDGADVQL
jgi:LuxR family maltose regulon positive regulatory protein